MITYVYGDLFYSPARVLVNPVNTVGTMSAGLSFDFKRFYPDMFDWYRDICQEDRLMLGQLLLYRTPHKWVLNFPTKRHFRANATVDAIEAGLAKFARTYDDQQITSVSFPALGTGEDGLTWETVRPLMESYLAGLPISVYIHLSAEGTPFAPPERSIRTVRNWLNGIPAQETFERFWKQLLEAIKKQSTLRTLDSREEFTIVATEARGRQRISIKITPKRADSIFLPETQLRDLWQYITRAGYILPSNLPAGLEAHASYMIALLSQLPTIKPIQLAAMGSNAVIGMQYVAPLDQKDVHQRVELKAE